LLLSVALPRAIKHYLSNMALYQRLLRDIKDLKENPYPNIAYTPYENDFRQGCLVLCPNGGDPLHLTLNFPADYPLTVPRVTLDSFFMHPNTFGTYICADILKNRDAYTPAYDLKGIAIQLLSFFASDILEQDYGGAPRDLRHWRNMNAQVPQGLRNKFCEMCGLTPTTTVDDLAHKFHKARIGSDHAAAVPVTRPSPGQDDGEEAPTDIHSMPDEVLCAFCDNLETEEMLVFARAWNRIGTSNGVVTRFNLVRKRELQCFILKTDTTKSKLGFGIDVAINGRQGTLSSEFELLSLQAFTELGIRKSVHGLGFIYWLPVALTRKHYNSVKDEVVPRLNAIRIAARLDGVRPVDTIFHFMNDIVVKLSADTESTDRSSLGKASEKAIDSYYSLFHLLLCLAVDDPSIVRTINQKIQGVLNGSTSKQDIPNLGYLLIWMLISDADMTEDVMKAIIREAITRNVVWMLEPIPRGKGMTELAYMEADTVSNYRLEKTYEAGRTSYRLLMFLNLFRKTINRGTGQERKSLTAMRDELFDAYGSPPAGTAARLAQGIRAIGQVDTFPKFLQRMDLVAPTAGQFTQFLRDSMEESVRKGYSVWGVSQARALSLRQGLDPEVQVREEVKPEWRGGGAFQVTFFPGRSRGGGRGGRGGARGGRGGRGGRGH
jgi:ubiquitin-protein ligase